jgi:hypothetical protein
MHDSCSNESSNSPAITLTLCPYSLEWNRSDEFVSKDALVKV